MDDIEVEVFFELKQEDDWPPVSVEGVWASRVGDSHFRLNNVPYFASGFSYGDIVGVCCKDGCDFVCEIIVPSEYTTVHVFSFDKIKSKNIFDWAVSKGCVVESAYDGDFYAIAIPLSLPKEVWVMKMAELESKDDDGFEYEISALRHL